MSNESYQVGIRAILSKLFQSTINYLPTFIGALLVLIAGIFIAQLAKIIVKKALKNSNLSKLAENKIVKELLKQGNFSSNLEDFLGEILRWLILSLFFITFVQMLGLTTVSEFLDKIINFLPKIFSAGLILLLGLIVSAWVENRIKGLFAQINPATGRLLGKAGSYTIFGFTLLAAIGELGIASQFIIIIFVGVVSSISLGFGIAFGLGSKDLVKEIVEKWYHKLEKN